MSYTSAVRGRDLGMTNKKWGDCGFTSAFYAMWKLDKATRPALQGMPHAFTVIEEIRKYLESLKTNGCFKELSDIESFCQSFGGVYSSFTIEKYILQTHAARGKDENTLLGENFSIGMPPHCVKDYLLRVWKHESEVIDCSKQADDGSDGIIGLCVPPGTKDPGGTVVATQYNHLVHFIYRHSNKKYYSWGDPPYSDLVSAAHGGGLSCFESWRVGWLIKIGKKVT